MVMVIWLFAPRSTRRVVPVPFNHPQIVEWSNFSRKITASVCIANTDAEAEPRTDFHNLF